MIINDWCLLGKHLANISTPRSQQSVSIVGVSHLITSGAVLVSVWNNDITGRTVLLTLIFIFLLKLEQVMLCS
jgi:hypothetical protein